MASSFLIYADLTARKAVNKVGGTNFSFPTFTAGEDVSLAFRFTETKAGSTVQVYPNIAGMRAAIGASDAAPTGGTFALSINGSVTAALPFSATADQLQNAINAVLTAGVTCSVTQDGTSFVITFSDGSSRTIVGALNDLDPVSLIRVRLTTLANTVEHEVTLVQAPLAATNVWNPIVPPAPSVVKIQSGSTDASGTVLLPTIEALTIPSTFQGTFVLTYNNFQTTQLSVSSGTSQIASAINALFAGTGQTVSVTNPQASVANIAFDGSSFIGNDQPLLGVSVISYPPGDNTLVLDLNTSGCYEALREADTLSTLYLEVEADIIPDGQSSSNTANSQTVTLFRQKVSLQRPINWPGLEASSSINWAVPPGPTSYIPYSSNQTITGSQFYTVALGDGTSTNYTVTHNLGTENLHLTLRNNATGALLVNGSDYHAVVSTNTVALTFPSALTSGQVVAVISTAGPTSAFVSDFTINASQVIGLASQLSSLTSTVSTLQSILPTTRAGVIQSTSAAAVTFPLSVVSECVGYLGSATPSATTGYLASQLPVRPPSLLTSSNFDRELWNVPMNSSILALGRTLSIDWGVTLQALRANCGVSYNLVVEVGNYSEGSNLTFTWNTSSPVFVQPIVLTEDLITHSFGIGISRLMVSGVDTLHLDQQLYGVWNGNNSAAPSSANFAIRCRLIGLNTESYYVQSDPRAWISYGLVPSLTASNGASLAQVTVQ